MSSSYSELVETALERIDEAERLVQALLPESGRADRLRVEAAATSPGDGPLLGIPVGVKDIINVDGFDTRAGSQLPATVFAGAEASAVGRLRDAGALILGKTVTTEFAYRDPGPTTNPHDPERTPGGSSSGSAAAVAAGYTPLALGTQTVDSIVTPAAYCGVVGFKPSYGRVPIDGVVPFAPSMDHLGCLAADVGMAATAASVLCDDWAHPPTAGDVKLGLAIGDYLARADPAALQSFAAQVGRVTDAGIEVIGVDALEGIDEVVTRHRALTAFEFAEVHREWFDEYGDLYRPQSRELVFQGQSVPPQDAAAAIEGAILLQAELEALQERHTLDAWLAPGATGPAPLGLDAIGDATMAMPWTHAHLPVVALPADRPGDQHPLGIQLAGRMMGDEDLLATALVVEDILAA